MPLLITFSHLMTIFISIKLIMSLPLFLILVIYVLFLFFIVNLAKRLSVLLCNICYFWISQVDQNCLFLGPWFALNRYMCKTGRNTKFFHLSTYSIIPPEVFLMHYGFSHLWNLLCTSHCQECLYLTVSSHYI